jgi:O-antigen biosynthesis protein
VSRWRGRVNLPARRSNQYYGIVSYHGPSSDNRGSRTQSADRPSAPELAALKQALRHRTSELESAERHIGKLEEQLFKLKNVSRELKQLRREKEVLRKSPERRIGQVLLAPYRLPQKLFRAFWRGKQGGNHSAVISRAALEYQRWFERHRAKSGQLKAMRAEARTFSYQPLISVITPVFDPPTLWLEQTVASMIAQAYGQWELILVDDASTNPAIASFLEKIAAREPRIRVFRRERNNGISATSNYAIEQARGEWLGLLDHDDTLEPDALFCVAKVLQTTPDADLIYSDEDKLGDAGVERPQFKPDWSPDLFASGNYISHFTVLRRAIVERVGGFRSEFDGAQDYDLLLRVIEETDRIHHIPRVLYHWRRSASSSAIDVRQKPAQFDAARRAVEDHFERIRVGVRVGIDWPTHTFRVQRELTDAQKISIIVPAVKADPHLSAGLERVQAKTDYPHYELLLVDGPEFDMELPRNVRRLEYRGAITTAALNNFAARETDSPWLLFLSGDVEPVDNNWLVAMTEHIQRPEVGAVGARLLNFADTVQHAGIVLGVDGIAGEVCRGFAAEDVGANRQAQLTRNCSAVSGACLLTRRDVFERCGGFDEDPRLAPFADVDLCLKIRRDGYLIVYTPFATLRRHNISERRCDPATAELIAQRWGDALRCDPYYNPNLSRARGDFSLGN